MALMPLRAPDPGSRQACGYRPAAAATELGHFPSNGRERTGPFSAGLAEFRAETTHLVVCYDVCRYIQQKKCCS